MFHISLPTMISWANPIETFTITLLNSWMTVSSWIYVTGGSQGVWLLTLLIGLMLNMFLLCSSFIEDIPKICFDGSQLCSFKIIMCWHVSISSSVGYQVINPHLYPTINIGVWVLKSASIPSDLCWLIGLSQIDIPKSRHLLGFIKVFSVLFHNHKPWPKISSMTSLDSIVY